MNFIFDLLIVPSGFSLILQTHLQPISSLFGGRETSVQVPFFMSASYSAVMAVVHSGLAKACLAVVGSTWARSSVGCSLRCPCLQGVNVWWSI